MSEQIGIRELRQHASRYVAKCAAGESFVITERGRPVGVLAGGWEVIRLHASELIDSLVTSGRYPSRAAALSEAVDDLIKEMERAAVDTAIVAGYGRRPAKSTVDDWGELGEQVDVAARTAWNDLDEW